MTSGSDVAKLARGVIVAGLTELPKSEHAGFAGYVMFARNGSSAKELRAFTDALRALCSDASPLIAIDQEGGRVARLTEGVQTIPSMMAVGAAGDTDLSERAGEQIAFDLRRAGCTLDFAPVLDLALDPRNTVIGTRSFGADPRRVADLGRAFARGMLRGGVTPCYKHFPGHGSTAVDSHEALPVIDSSAETLIGRDIAPFAAVAHEASAMMTAHVRVPSFDGQRPATVSSAIASELLRSTLGFNGALVTDCLEMGAIGGFSAGDALRAGADLLLFSHDLERAVEAAERIEYGVAAGEIPLARLEEAYARVGRLRAAAKPPVALDAFPPHPNIGREIGRRAITLVRGVPEADPLVSFAISFGAGGASLQREAPVLATLEVSLDPAKEEVEQIFAALERTQRRPLLLARRAHLHPAQATGIATILERYRNGLVVSMLEPFDLPLFTGARHLLAAYGDDAASVGGLADVLFGASMPAGNLPVSLPAGS